MIKIENTEVFGIESAIRGMRNPKNSWERSDSEGMRIGENDLKLCTTLIKGGTEHRKFLRFIHVQADVVAPLYWFKEYDTYKVGTVANSCSTMHKITSKPIILPDFSIENVEVEGEDIELRDCFINVVADCEMFRKKYLETKDKRYWKALIQLLPCAYNQKRTIDLNYEVLMNIHRQRKNHKLTEWHDFCDWIESLPYMEVFLA